jgi:hypothetical protein
MPLSQIFQLYCGGMFYDSCKIQNTAKFSKKSFADMDYGWSSNKLSDFYTIYYPQCPAMGHVVVTKYEIWV